MSNSLRKDEILYIVTEWEVKLLYYVYKACRKAQVI